MNEHNRDSLSERSKPGVGRCNAGNLRRNLPGIAAVKPACLFSMHFTHRNADGGPAASAVDCKMPSSGMDSQGRGDNCQIPT